MPAQSSVRAKITKLLEKGRLTDQNGRLAQTIAAKTGASTATVSSTLTAMAKAGIIERQADRTGTYAIWLTPSANGHQPASGDIIEGIINAVGKLKADNERLTQELDIVVAENAQLQKAHEDDQKIITKLRAELDQKQLEISAAHRQLEQAQRDAAAKNEASAQIAKLREMLNM